MRIDVAIGGRIRFIAFRVAVRTVRGKIETFRRFQENGRPRFAAGHVFESCGFTER
jgi:hypothetical protein